jgi:hypothetical protein
VVKILKTRELALLSPMDEPQSALSIAGFPAEVKDRDSRSAGKQETDISPKPRMFLID